MRQELDGRRNTPRIRRATATTPGWNSPDSKTPPSASGAMRSSKPQVKACRSSEACADSTMPLKSRQDCEWRPPASSASRLYSESSSGSNLPLGTRQ